MFHTLIVLDSDAISPDSNDPDIISFEQYLRDYPKLKEPKTRVINLCDTAHYLSKGYYCSLLAEARQHIALPSVKTINELRHLGDESASLIGFTQDLKHLLPDGDDEEFLVYFGWTEKAPLQKLAKKLFSQYPAPILKMTLSGSGNDLSLQIHRHPYAALNAEQSAVFAEKLKDFTRTVWKRREMKKRYRWDMAILCNPDEKVPPSNKEAIARFIKAAAKHGIYAEKVTAEQARNIDLYDALFIRETTAIDHHTYRLACKAENKGLVVLDDPTSILRCCNKVYLHDAFSYQRVPSLRTTVVNDDSDATLAELERSFGYPLVLKMPEGSFSDGVYKARDRDELQLKLKQLFSKSALVLAQEYLYTDFDWRVGVLNGRAIYACRYLMARDHWQIYNHGAKRFFAGSFETVPTFEVPRVVLDAALKAARIIGNGLYGVDIKQVENHAYVLEVNDNPSIDHKVEDLYLGDELYMLVMAEFQQRLEQRGRG